MSDDVTHQRSSRWQVVVFSAIALLVAGDLVIDYREGASFAHIAAESVILIVAAASALGIWLQLQKTRTRLSTVEAEAYRWREKNDDLIQGFSAAIATQFNRWGLTQAETEIGFLLLKGLSHKDIARRRNTSERTVREQSRSLYRKSGISGRTALSAFFLASIVAPGQSSEEALTDHDSRPAPRDPAAEKEERNIGP